MSADYLTYDIRPEHLDGYEHNIDVIEYDKLQDKSNHGVYLFKKIDNIFKLYCPHCENNFGETTGEVQDPFAFLNCNVCKQNFIGPVVPWRLH